MQELIHSTILNSLHINKAKKVTFIELGMDVHSCHRSPPPNLLGGGCTGERQHYDAWNSEVSLAPPPPPPHGLGGGDV